MTSTKNKAKEIAANLTDSQKTAVLRGLVEGEKRRQDKGQARLQPRNCWIGHGTVAGPTARKLNDLGLLDYRYLTALGVQVARVLFPDVGYSYGHNDEDYEDKSKVKVATTVEEYVSALRREADERKQAHAALVVRARNLWQGFKVDQERYVSHGKRGDGYTKNLPLIIKEEFEHESLRNGLNLDLEDLIALGEQVQALRTKEN